MKLLLDTHYLVWMINATQLLTPSERGVLSDSEHQLFASSVSIWEIRLKWQTRDREGERKGTVDPADALAYINASGITLASLSGEDCATAIKVPLAHRDPFDEQLLIHAQRLDAKLFTRDRLLAGHPLVYRFG